MSKTVEIGITADTSKAEKAITDLSVDVDKLQRKAQKVQEEQRSRRRGGRREDGDYERRRDQRRPDVDVKVINNQTSKLGDSIGGLASVFEGFADKLGGGFADLYAKIQLLKSGVDKGLETFNKISEERLKHRKEWGKKIGIGTDLSEGSIKFYQNRSYRKFRDDFFNKSKEKYDTLKLAKDLELRIQRNQGWEITHKKGKPGSYRFVNGRLRPAIDEHWTPLPGTKAAMHRASYHFGTGSYIRGAGSLARAGISAAHAGLAGIGGGSAITGAITGGALTALAAPAAIGTAYLADASGKVDQGRPKVEELTKLNTKLSQLTKNLTGSQSSAAAFSEEIQKLAMNGVVPMENLAAGASMLMLAFKGNQKESSKWLNILADMSAGTGESVEFFSELITRANQFGSVEFEVFNQLNEKGIPILDQLKGKFGDTKEEIEKAAQAGKITAKEFMAAFEAAHKVSMEGSNVAQKIATLSDYQKQRAEYEQLEAANYTRGYDARMTDFEKERTEYAKQRAEDESVIAQGEALGSVLASLTEKFKSLGEHLDHFGDTIYDTVFGWTGLTDAQAGLNVSNMRLWNTSTRVMEDGINRFAEEGDPDRYYSAAELANAITEVERNKERLGRISADEDLDEDVRKRAAEALQEADELLTNLDTAYEKAVKREQELAEARAEAAEAARKAKEAEETKTKFLRENAKTDRELLSAYGFSGKFEIKDEMSKIADRIKGGTGSKADLERYDELTDLLADIESYQNKQKEKAEEKTKKAQELAEKNAKEERARELYRMERDIAMNPDDPERKFAHELEVATDKLKALGFSADEASEMLTENRAYQIKEKEKELEKNNKQIESVKQEIEDGKKTGLSMETNAWGSTGNLYTNFTSPVDEQQLKELEKVNVNLNKEIDALNRLDIRAYAQ